MRITHISQLLMLSFFLLSTSVLGQLSIQKSHEICNCMSNNFEQIGVDFKSFLGDFEKELKENSLISDDLSSYQRLLDHSLNIYGFVPIHRRHDNEMVNAHLVRISDFCFSLHLGAETDTEAVRIRQFVQKWRYLKYLEFGVQELNFDPYMKIFSPEGLNSRLSNWLYMQFLYLLMPPYNPFRSDLGGIVEVEVLEGGVLDRDGQVIKWDEFKGEMQSYLKADAYLKISYQTGLDLNVIEDFNKMLDAAYNRFLEEISIGNFGQGYWSLSYNDRQNLLELYPMRLIDRN